MAPKSTSSDHLQPELADVEVEGLVLVEDEELADAQ